MRSLLLGTSVLSSFFQVVPIVCVVGIIYGALRYVKIKKNTYKVSWDRELIKLFFVCYITGLVNLVLTPANMWSYIWFYILNGYSGGSFVSFFDGSFNFVPSIFGYMTGSLELGGWVKTMLVGNVLMFVPMGVFLPIIWEKIKGLRAIVISAAIPIVIEVLQPVIGRSVDIDDIIMNTLGILTGCLAVFVYNKVSKRIQSKGKDL